ncbi:WD repeat-containing protein 93 [Stegastes partitus]|uniref:WD repeat-containing protein 93 n=1 Tax=Stegastes partitus TaxID=144197 RepID=A0A9Y4NJD7_9TELE|nr:PREDICTED: WD repeat-containing protein 93 [Stegastes partitus]
MEAADKIKKLRKATPTLELPSVTQLPESTNCLACSEDGRYLCLGHCRGLSVWSASSLTCVSEWLQDRLEITSVQMTRIAEMTYLLGTVDDMGVARVFAHHSDVIHLFGVINIMEDVNKRSICLTFELHEGGHYGAASVSCNGAAWLEVYHFPSAAWLEELERASSQKQDPNSSGEVDVKWSPVAVMIKIKPPKILAGRPLDGPPEVSQTTDYLAHCVALDVIMNSSRQWQKTSFNVEPMPDVLWPHAKEILCSAVSRCTRYIALGLDDALVCVWDRLSGAPLAVVLVPAENSAFIRMQFTDYWSVCADDSEIFTAEKVHLLLLCKSGEIHTVTTGRGTQSCTTQLTERPEDSRDFPSVITSVPFLQGLSLVVKRNGKMFLQDVINKTTVCFLTPPTTHLVSTPCSPVYALNAKLQTLFIRGDQDTSCSASSEDSSQSQLFIFRFRESGITKQFVISHPDSPQQQKTLSYDTLEETCNVYLQQRALSVAERTRDIMKTWERLQETAVTLQQRQ